MKKHKEAEKEENLERWLVSYADFITLLFAFFTTMYALSMTDKSKKQAAMEAIEAAFMSAGGIFPLKGTPFSPFPDKPGSQVPPSQRDKGKQGKSGSQKEDADALNRIAYQTRQLFENTTGLSLKGGEFEILKTEEGFKMRLGEQMLFGAGSPKIKEEYVPFLHEVGQRLARLGLQIQVEGHTDNSPSKSDQTNWQLSLSRAYNLTQFLVEACQYPEDKISMAGYGETRPLADNDTPEGRSRNRRVEIGVITNNREIANLPW